ncbi:MAG: hypothetical protein IPJ17_06000 [Holophagales bacterium]|nr:MAG: hypothetical protein IPJ17_06000 [Holophagales bacterium]
MNPRAPFALASLFALAATTAALAGPGGNRCSRSSSGEPLPFAGKVVTVEREPGAGTTLVLDNGQEQQRLHLGPVDVLERQKIVFAAGDAVAGVAFDAPCRHDARVVGWIEKSASHEKVTLRDEAGQPSWRGEGRGSAGEGRCLRAGDGEHAGRHRGARAERGPRCGAEREQESRAGRGPGRAACVGSRR